MIRRVNLPAIGVQTSCLGFGCASLGSRASSREGLRAIGQAFDAGVTWFDVAPAYGGGLAETLLGEFVRGRREKVQICTKVGLRAPRRSAVLRGLLPIARRLLSSAPGLRRVARSSSMSRNEILPLTADLISTSIAGSLAAMGVDHVDVLALHSPPPDAIGRDDVLGALRRVLERGQAHAVAVAGSAEAALVAAELGSPYAVIQLPDDPLASALEAVRAASVGRETAFITHSVFGVGGAFAAARERLRGDAPRRESLAALGYEGTAERVAADVLLDRALASNPEGVVLASMFSPAHLKRNVDRASRPVSTHALRAAEILFA
jgi:aryl-alcohol dehydrogenase-like predicted oxidoreductase